MSSGENRRSSEVLETNLDDVEVDEDGNLRYADESAVDSNDGDGYSTGVDEDGNLRIQLRLLNELKDHSEASPEDGLSAEETASQRRRQSERRHYSDDATAEEEVRMPSLNRRPLSGRRRSLILALDSFARDLNDDPDGATPEGQDVRDIELTVFELPLPEEPRGSVHGLESGDTEHHSAESTSRKKGLKRFPGIVGRALTSLSPDRLAIIVAIIVVVIGVLLTVSLLPISFVYVEYYELALAKSRISGKVNREDVYYPGCHLLTPDTELVRFKGTAHFLEKTVGVFTSDRLSFSMRISLQYFIKPEELGQLFTNYAHNYEPVVEAMITSTIQNTAIVFNLDTFRLNRSHVEHTLRQAVGLRLSGNCCPSCCPLKCSGGVNCRACLLAGRGCTKGIHMDLKHFQMGAVGIPEEVSERFLRQTLLLIEAERELFVQKHAVETKISEQMQKDILNKASEIREEATAEAQKIRDIAEADYDKQIQTSYAKALKKFYQHLNITREDHKLSFMYIRALEDISDNLYNLDYDKLTSF